MAVRLSNCPKCDREIIQANYVKVGETTVMVCQCGYYRKEH